LVHISDVSPVWDLPGSDQQAINLLSQFQGEISKSLNYSMKEQMSRCNVQYETIIKFGNSQKELMNVLASTKADLLIMGHRGQTGFFSLGSFAEKMIASSSIPVLIAKNNKDIKKISYLIDPTRFFQDSISEAKDLAALLNARIQFHIYIAEPSSTSLINIPFIMPSYKFSEQEKEQIANDVKKHFSVITNSSSEDDIHVEISNQPTARALTNSLVEQQADLAIVSKHNRGALEKYFIGSTSKGILQEFDGNILVN
jgi:nucleotide-binding universal stress UspA family protein